MKSEVVLLVMAGQLLVKVHRRQVVGTRKLKVTREGEMKSNIYLWLTLIVPSFRLVNRRFFFLLFIPNDFKSGSGRVFALRIEDDEAKRRNGNSNFLGKFINAVV